MPASSKTRKILIASVGVAAAAYACGNGTQTGGNLMLYPEDALALDSGAHFDVIPQDTAPSFDVSVSDASDASDSGTSDVVDGDDGDAHD